MRITEVRKRLERLAQEQELSRQSGEGFSPVAGADSDAATGEKTSRNVAGMPGRVPRVALGLDGFIDRIAHRALGADGAPLASMGDLGGELAGRGERSASLRLTGVQTRPGGNMPNTALALGAMGVDCVCVGALGYPRISEAFAPLARTARLLSFGEPGFCLAVEFDACKLFLSDNGGLNGMTVETMLKRLGEDELRAALEGLDALALLNWGEVPEMNDLWRGLAARVLPTLKRKPGFVYLDVADLAQRTEAEARSLLDTLADFKAQAPTYLSVNDGELNALAAKLLGAPNADNEAEMRNHARRLYALNGVDALIHHSRGYARALDGTGEARRETRLAEKPVLQTGGGDNFNAGYMLGLLAGLDAEGCLATGNAASGCYVRTGRCARIDDIIEEIGRATDAPMNEEAI